ncbi:FAD-dependent monooxygenase [Streptomyces sp. NBC_00726]|uniref:FAD-dependent monooxygenase n=1 Tax=Streptomyces sp. NBC_00726 TaxID=2903674 RepID=UPI00386D2302
MNKPAETVHDVAVVGAGPVGMALACLLASSGVHPVVLERLTGPSGVTKVGSIGPQAVEALAKCGVYDDLADAERQTLLGYAAMAGGGRRTASGSGGGARQVRGEHFAGMGGIDSSAYVTDRRRRMLIEQPVIVSILLKRAAEHGVQPRWDHEVTGLTQHEDHVAVTVTAGGAERTVRARYVIGADGPHSTVRKLAGFEFPGTPGSLTARQALVELDRDGAVPPAGFIAAPGGMLAYGTAVNSLGTFEFDGPPSDDGPMTREELQASVDRVHGEGVRITSVSEGSRYTDTSRQAATYRSGRVFLAGDSAHIHPPIGAQGLTLGLGDALNLAWKLAVELRGDAPAGLLDTYTTERHPVAAELLSLIRAQTALMRPDAHSRALRGLFARLMVLPQVNDWLARTSGFFDVRHDMGPGQDVDDALTGTFCSGLDQYALDPDSPQDAPVPLADLYDGRRGLLVVFPAGDADREELRRSVSGRVRVVRSETPWQDEVRAVLLRPDGCVAWAARTGEPWDPEALCAAEERWLGAETT